MISWLINYPNLILSYPAYSSYLSRFADVVKSLWITGQGAAPLRSLDSKGNAGFLKSDGVWRHRGTMLMRERDREAPHTISETGGGEVWKNISVGNINGFFKNRNPN